MSNNPHHHSKSMLLGEREVGDQRRLESSSLVLAWWTERRISWIAACVASLAVLFTIGDPGITCDEPLDVRPGRTYVKTLLSRGGRFFTREVADLVFRDNAEHPPLGRWLLGIASRLGEPFERTLLGGTDPFSVHAGRLAPAIAFGVLVGLTSLAAGSRGGRIAGVASGLALLFMPRVFAHAHFAALDTFLSLFWMAALLAAERALHSPRPGRAMALAGLVWGLAVLTKMPAWLLIPIVGIRAFVVLGARRGLAATAVWLTAGVATFFVGWPWLWWQTGSRLAAYFGTSFERISIRTMYFGQVYQDRDVPWHYPWFYFVTTVPLGLQLVGLIGAVEGLRKRRSDGFPLLLLGSILGVLGLFGSRLPDYDGERLFLFLFPMWAILIGLGFAAVWNRVGSSLPLRRGLAMLMIAQAFGLIVTHPFGLSYFNLLVAGLPGAQRLGLELTYWGDPIDRNLLDELASHAKPGETAAMIPTLHHVQALASTTEVLAKAQVTMMSQETALKSDWVVVQRRSAYWPVGLAEWLGEHRPVALRSRQGVWLAGIWKGPVVLKSHPKAPISPLIRPSDSPHPLHISRKKVRTP